MIYNDVENRMMFPYADEYGDEFLSSDPDADYKAEQADLDRVLADLNERRLLSRDIGIAISHISKRNSFDKDGLIKLLKRTRSHIDNTPDVDREEVHRHLNQAT